MQSLVVRNIVRFVSLVAVQVYVLNKIYLGGYISPMLYPLFILMLPTRLNRKYTLLLAFLLGLCIDICSNMLGFHCCATTVMAFCRITFAERIITRGEDVVIDVPSIFSVQSQYFVYYSALLLLIHSFVFYTLDYFSIADIFDIVLSSMLSATASLVLVILWQLVFNRRKKTR